MLKKLAIGTVQFGLNYGINNTYGKTKPTEVFKILEFAKKIGIDTLDTARGYGNSEEVLGKYKDIGCFKIVSKFASIKNINESIKQSLKNLNINTIYGYLFHSFEDFLENEKYINNLYKLKEEKKVKKIGFSLYFPEEIEILLEKDIKFDIVQIPYNIFDRRFEKILPVLKKNDIEVHIRSVFLQGLFFLKDIPPYFEKVKPKLNLLNDICNKYSIQKNHLLLIFALSNPYIDKVVIGVNSLYQLKENTDLDYKFAENVLKNIDLSIFKENDYNIILPFKWKV